MASDPNGEREICRGPFRSTCGGIKTKQLPAGILHRLAAREYIKVQDTLSLDSLFNCENKDLTTLREMAFGAGIGDAYSLDKRDLCNRLSKLRLRIHRSKRILGDMLGMGEDVAGHGFYSLIGKEYHGYHYRARAALLYLKSILPIDYLGLLWEDSPQLERNDKSINVHIYENPIVLELPDNTVDVLKASMMYKYIASTITIIYPKEVGTRHANAIIFDNRKRILQIWEPNINILKGNSEKWAKAFEDVFQRWVDELGDKYEWFGKGWVVQHSIQFCPKMDLGAGSYATAPQDIDLDKKEEYREALAGIVGDESVKNDLLGYCLFWSTLLIYIKMKNPNAKDEDIMKYITSMDRVEVGDLVRQFTSFVAKIFNKMGRKYLYGYYIRRGDYINFIMDAKKGKNTSMYRKDFYIKVYGIVDSVDNNRIRVWSVKEADLGSGIPPKLYLIRSSSASLTDENIYNDLREHFRINGKEIPT